ncbi:hypothetical protein DRO64_01125, partial [Candidatus Bathyarchaeota archaeon]
MSNNSNLIIHMPEPQKQLSLKNGIRIQVSRSKLDDLLIGFSNPSMQAYRVTEKIAKDNIGRCLFFLRSNFDLCILTANQINAIFRAPLLLNYDYDLDSHLQRNDIKRKHEEFKVDLERYQGELEDLNWSLTQRIFDTILTDQRLINAFKSRSRERVKETLQRVIQSRRKEFLEIIQEAVKIYPIFPKITSLKRILVYTSIARDAQLNSKALKLFIDFRNDPDLLFDALSRLANLMQMKIESFCLDCVY